MKIIGLAGKAGSGKDHAHQVLKEYYEQQGLKTTRLSFASRLKDISTLLFGWDRHRLDYDIDYKETMLNDGVVDPACEMLGMTRRVFMQKLGTEAMRDGIHNDFWIICLQLDINSGMYDGFDIGFVTDCRFANEFDFIHKNEGELIKIVRTDTGTLTTETTHSSETGVDNYSNWSKIILNEVDSSLSLEENNQIFLTKLVG